MTVSNACRGICILQYSVKGKQGGVRYLDGFKRCITCDTWIKYDGFHCPCCGYRIRSLPHNMKTKNIYKNSLLKIKLLGKKS